MSTDITEKGLETFIMNHMTGEAAKKLPNIGNSPEGDPLDDVLLEDEDAALEEVDA